MTELSENEKIQELVKNGKSLQSVADEFNVSKSLVQKICRKIKKIR